MQVRMMYEPMRKIGSAMTEMQQEQQNTRQQEQENARISCALKDFLSDPKREIFFYAGLGISYVVADYVFLVLVTILTKDWQLKLDQAVTITNIQEASQATLTVVCAYLADSKLGNSKMLSIASGFYIIGVILLSLAYPHFTAQEIHQCETTDICPRKKLPLKLYFGLVSITFGQCGSFLYECRNSKEAEDVEVENNGRQNCLIVVLKELRKVPYNGCRISQPLKRICVLLSKKIDWIYVIGMFIAIFVFPLIAGDNIYAALRYMLSIGGGLFTLGKFGLYGFDKPPGSPLSVYCGVIGLACFKGSIDNEAQTLYFGDENNASGQNLENDQNEAENSVDFEEENSEAQTSLHFGDENNASGQILENDQNEAENSVDFEEEYVNDEAQTSVYIGDENDVNGNHHHERAIELTEISSAASEAPKLETEESRQNVEEYKNFTNFLRCLNKAAYYDPASNSEDLRDKGKLYSIQQVEETKRFIRAFLLSSLFLFYGIMTAVCSTFFVDQANIMDRHIGFIDVPIALFVLSSKLIQKIVSQICKWIIPKEDDNASAHGFNGAFRVLFGIFLSVPCFLIAFAIEKKRLNATNETSAFYLLPQLFLVGAMDGLALTGMEVFFDKEMPKGCNRLYGEFLAEGATGLGKFLSVGFFHIVRNLTKTANKPGWFGDDLDNSHLDYYYFVMAVVGVISTAVYVVVAVLCYCFKARA